MRMQTKCTRAQRAAEYLKRVAALSGAKQDDDGTYHLTAGGTHFLVDAKLVRWVEVTPQSSVHIEKVKAPCRMRATRKREIS